MTEGEENTVCWMWLVYPIPSWTPGRAMFSQVLEPQFEKLRTTMSNSRRMSSKMSISGRPWCWYCCEYHCNYFIPLLLTQKTRAAKGQVTLYWGPALHWWHRRTLHKLAMSLLPAQELRASATTCRDMSSVLTEEEALEGHLSLR